MRKHLLDSPKIGLNLRVLTGESAMLHAEFIEAIRWLAFFDPS